jgi:hypothetical protein
MAVRHGYGKIAGADALVFAYDTGDTVNSYKGKPATNIATAIQSRGGGVTADPSDLPTVPKSVAPAVYCSSKINGSTTSWESLFRYNTSFSVPNGQRFTVSAWVYIPEDKVNNRFNFNCSVNGANTGLTVGSHDVPTGRWVKIHGHYVNSTGATVSVATTRLETYTAAEWTGTSISCWAINFMIEQNADIPSGYTGAPATALGATRSVSGSLLDLTGNTSIDLTNAGFDSNAQLDFDGTNTYIPKFTDSRFQFADTDLTYEVVVNFNSNPDSYQTLIGLADTNDYIPRFNLSKFRSGTGVNGKVGNVYMQLIDQNGSGVTAGDPDLSGADLAAGGYYHYVGVISKPAGSSTYYVYLYRNGELVTTVNSGRTTYDTTQGVQGSIGLAIGTQFGNTASVLDGQLPVTKIYNRALTAGEVKNNYSHYKNRFGI